MIGEADVANQVDQLFPEQQQGVASQVGQRIAGDVRRHERMAVAVTAHPGSNAQPGERRGVLEQVGIEVEVRPGLLQPLVHQGQHVRVDPAHVVQDVAPLG